MKRKKKPNAEDYKHAASGILSLLSSCPNWVDILLKQYHFIKKKVCEFL